MQHFYAVCIGVPLSNESMDLAGLLPGNVQTLKPSWYVPSYVLQDRLGVESSEV